MCKHYHSIGSVAALATSRPHQYSIIAAPMLAPSHALDPVQLDT
jgi:hypothetical protein